MITVDDHRDLEDAPGWLMEPLADINNDLTDMVATRRSR